MSETDVPSRIIMMSTPEVNRYAYGMEKELEAQTALIAELVEALKPFGEAATVIEEDLFPDTYPVHAAKGADGNHRYQLQARHFSRTLRALSKAKLATTAEKSV